MKKEIYSLEGIIKEDIVFGSRHLIREGDRVLPGGWFWSVLAKTPVGTRVKLTIEIIEEASEEAHE